MDKETNCLTYWIGGCLSQGGLFCWDHMNTYPPCFNVPISGILLWQGNYGYFLVSWVVCKLKGKGIRGIGS